MILRTMSYSTMICMVKTMRAGSRMMSIKIQMAVAKAIGSELLSLLTLVHRTELLPKRR